MELIFAISPFNIIKPLSFQEDIINGHVIVMGYNTFKNIGYKPYENCINIIITKNINNKNKYENVIYANMINIFCIIDEYSINKKTFIIGGNHIFLIFFPYCNIIHMTVINDSNDSNDSNHKLPFNKDYLLYNNYKIIDENENINYKYYKFLKT